MTQFGYQASHEHFPPSKLLNHARLAEKAGFKAALSSDHFNPWLKSQGNSGFAFAWLGAALQATGLTFGMVTAPGFRYHPAVLAQAVATLHEMFPGRFFLTMGSGEAINEMIVGRGWPLKAERNRILEESAGVMRRLWRGEEVTHYGSVVVEAARLYIPLERTPEIFGAALSELTARWMGGWADGMITTARPLEDLKRMVSAFREGGGEGKPILLKVDLSYDATREAALQGAYDLWRNALLPAAVIGDLRTVEQFEAVTGAMPREAIAQSVIVSSDPFEMAGRIAELAALGFEKIILHNVNANQERFIEDFGAKVLPALQ